jgi:hypothetical protein
VFAHPPVLTKALFAARNTFCFCASSPWAFLNLVYTRLLMVPIPPCIFSCDSGSYEYKYQAQPKATGAPFDVTANTSSRSSGFGSLLILIYGGIALVVAMLIGTIICVCCGCCIRADENAEEGHVALASTGQSIDI